MSSLSLLGDIFSVLLIALRDPAKHQAFHSCKTYLQLLFTAVHLWQVLCMLLLFNHSLKMLTTSMSQSVISETIVFLEATWGKMYAMVKHWQAIVFTLSY